MGVFGGWLRLGQGVEEALDGAVTVGFGLQGQSTGGFQVGIFSAAGEIENAPRQVR